MEHVIHIPQWRPATLNQLMGHWSKTHKLKKSDRQIIAHYCKDTPKATGKRRVSLHISLKGRQQKADPDAYWKSLLDALVACGQLINDNDANVELGTVTYDREVQAGTVITLTEVPLEASTASSGIQ